MSRLSDEGQESVEVVVEHGTGEFGAVLADGDLFAPAQDRFVAAARAHDVALDVLDVPGAHHPFELRDHTDDTRSAVTTAIDWMIAALASRKIAAGSA